MSTSSCTPVVVEGWGGAGDGCASVVSAAGVLGAVEGTLRAAYPEQWHSPAADEFSARLGDLLLHTHRLGDLLATAQQRAAALAAAVAEAWEDQ
ncbi:hypothetical protein SAMN05216184_10957 [Georgenia satyanarayanai]|uniref:Uncharacterized protein n=1 Tax=Georgenia satyanarayanai TaxID=860221 RepID=A0A2Y9ANM2_9MICO|nr:hypothetical protein [Georgenia satyanarayanai]PYF99035.1 hypothetical protein A8987_10957 [Georgenia satyanarayanai]SSA43997.1 hypothetical protein SAMN05216184_10957 [Georgenia satyanarayanai]